ncbi:MAG: extracellular solute-binding protein [Lacipirellulaceae bacterium]
MTLAVRFAPLLAFLLAALAGCTDPRPLQVVVYTTVPEEVGKPIFDAFTRQTGVPVVATHQAGRAVAASLSERLAAEREQPKCDLYWTDDPLELLRLEGLGVLRKQLLEAEAEYPADSRSPDHAWFGFALRARVIVVNKQLLKEDRWPRSLEALSDPQWTDKCGVSHPLAGASATHSACLFKAWGPERAEEYFKKLKRTCRVLSGSKQVAAAVARGDLWLGLVNSDDAMFEKEKGAPIELIYPDQPEAGSPDDALGTLFVPQVVAMIDKSPEPRGGQALAEFLLTPMVECRLVDGPGAFVPLNRHSNSPPRIGTPKTVTAMKADFAAAADGWADVSSFLTEEYGPAP